jgi:redox-sensing transcriptional repressor
MGEKIGSTSKLTPGVPEPTLRRMPTYLNLAKSLQKEGVTYVSSTRIARDVGVDPTQVTKDLTFTQVVGKTKVGYHVVELINAIHDFLGYKKMNEAFLIGAGNLGKALMSYEGFDEHGLKIIAAFDINPKIVGTEVNGLKVLHFDKFRDLAERMHVVVGIITVPVEVAQSVADLLIAWGIKGIWNFSPQIIKVPPHVTVVNTSIYANLAVLFNKMNHQNKDTKTV